MCTGVETQVRARVFTQLKILTDTTRTDAQKFSLSFKINLNEESFIYYFYRLIKYYTMIQVIKSID